MEQKFELSQMEQETEEMLRIRYLKKENALFSRTGTGFLSLQLGEEFYPRVKVVRMYPFTQKDEFISIRTSDEHSREIGIIEKLSDMEPDTLVMLKEQLALRYFTPIIHKINNIKDEYGYAYFDVETDHGNCRFTIQMGSNAVVHLSEYRILILDIDENRFEISDLTKLTARERKKLDLFL
ncbi:MAG TPA: DUF1854 domain-containing protein [Lachnospiraceae bacterium]|nr:DUF1854 domain-containing protein [Lachnospiraceae bacterium]